MSMKIMIIGSSGSGKSTFSRELGEFLKLPVYHLDAFFWRPGWVQTPHESIDWEFLKYGWNFRRDKRPGIMAKLESYSPPTKIIIIRKPKEASLMLEEIRRLGLSYFEESEAWGP